MLKKFLAVVFVTVALFLAVSAHETKASEGEIEIKSTRGDPARCYAVSILMRDLNYRILMSCRDITYAADPTRFIYLVWATPTSGGKPLKLGELGVGKVQFATKTAFSNIFVTEERNVGTKTPSSDVAMRGNVQMISFLEATPSPPPTLEADQQVASPTPEPQQGETIFSALKKAGLIFGGVVVLIVLVVIITRR